MKRYPDHRNIRDLEPHFSAHMEAMTVENLRDKGDIAVQLALRDKRIAELETRSCAQMKLNRFHACLDPNDANKVALVLHAEGPLCLHSEAAEQVHAAVEAKDKRIAELEDDANKLATALHHVAQEQRRCLMCGSAPHIGNGHASFCRAGKYLKAEAASGQ